MGQDSAGVVSAVAPSSIPGSTKDSFCLHLLPHAYVCVGFPQGTPVSSHIPRTCVLGLPAYSKLPPRVKGSVNGFPVMDWHPVLHPEARRWDRLQSLIVVSLKQTHRRV